MNHGFLHSSRYSPGNMDPASLEALFVGREHTVQYLVSCVVDSIATPEKHYWLLTGPRGSGKTHTLALAHQRILDRIKKLAIEDRVAIAFLNEEEWGVATYLDLLVRILRALAEQRPEIERDIKQIYKRFSNSYKEAEYFASSLVADHTRGRTLLLLCENLHDLFRGLDDEGQKCWRADIQERRNWCIVATTPTLFTEIRSQEYPFYGFFTVHQLENLDVETGRELLIKKALHEDKSELATFLRTPLGRRRVRAIHHLAAGNCRAYVVLSDFLEEDSLDNLIEPFMRMVDDLIPCYQDRMNQMPPAQRKIVEFLCLVLMPKTIKDIAAACLMSQQTASKQIAELAAAKVIDRIPSGRNTYCELTEPLMRICFEVKNNRTRHIRLFVEFLHHWFCARELETRHDGHQQDQDTDVLDRIYLEEALRSFRSDRIQPSVDVLGRECQRYLEVEEYQSLAAAQEALVRERGKADDFYWWVHALVLVKNHAAAVAAVEAAVDQFPPSSRHLYDVATAYTMEHRLDEALDAINKAVDLDPVDLSPYLCLCAALNLGLGRYEKVIPDADAVLDIVPDFWYCHYQVARAHIGLGHQFEARDRIAALVQSGPDNPKALCMASWCSALNNEHIAALRLVDQALALDNDDLSAHRLRSHILTDMAVYPSASLALREVIDREPDDIPAHYRLSDALYSIGDYRQATEVASRLIELDPTDSNARYMRGSALIKLGRIPEAINDLDGLLLTKDFRSLMLAASATRRIGYYDAAVRYLERATELQPDDLEPWRERTLVNLDAGNYDAARQNVARLEARSTNSLTTRLLAIQVSATTTPLDTVFERLDFDEDMVKDENIEAFSAILSVSVRAFGPLYLHQGVLALQKLLSNAHFNGILGVVLTIFVRENAKAFEGSLEHWDDCLNRLSHSLADQPDTEIPLQMLNAAVRYSKSADERHLLSLPLEQRQLLTDILHREEG